MDIDWKLPDLVQPHIDAYNAAVDPSPKGWLNLAVADLIPQMIRIAHDVYWKVSYHKLKIDRPKHNHEKSKGPRNTKDGVKREKIYDESHFFGNLPVMVKSSLCHLEKKSPEELIKLQAEEKELGGYFIISGLEKVIRMLATTKRNFILALDRKVYKKRGHRYTSYGVMVRSCYKDTTSIINILHYLETGDCTIEFRIGKSMFLLPVLTILKALRQTSDKELAQVICGNSVKSQREKLVSRAEIMLTNHLVSMVQWCEKENKPLEGISTQGFNLEHLGSRFRAAGNQFSEYMTNSEIGILLLEKYILPHCDTLQKKFDVLIQMLKKLFAVVDGIIQPDPFDIFSTQEALLPGHLITGIIKTNLEHSLTNLHLELRRKIVELEMSARRKEYSKSTKKSGKKKKKLKEEEEKEEEKSYKDELSKITEYVLQELKAKKASLAFSKAFRTCASKIDHFFATGDIGNLVGYEIQQRRGLVVMADHLNRLRFLSFFRAFHRGSRFLDLKIMDIRKLTPEMWGFICPAHTPDGKQCGLLNHITFPTRMTALETLASTEQLDEMVYQMTKIGLWRNSVNGSINEIYVPVFFNGQIIGSVLSSKLQNFVENLRDFKRRGINGFMKTMEILNFTGQYLHIDHPASRNFASIWISTLDARFIRPVIHLKSKLVEWISPSEQVSMNIAVSKREIIEGMTTHMEIHPTGMMSAIALTIPYSDYNQSPRNMYECQMAKQTLATPMYNYQYRQDSKIYRLNTPQKPLVETEMYKRMDLNGHALGTNAVVAVISYTGYDMEDAMIINKGSYERGFCHGTVYSSVGIDLENEFFPDLFYAMENPKITLIPLGPNPGPDNCFSNPQNLSYLDCFGLPYISETINPEQYYCCYGNKAHKSKSFGDSFSIENIAISGSDTSSLKKVFFKKRLKRNPTIGDKFASRHGQKGTLAKLWPQESMPFNGEEGICPDLIINPHAFPSRMTIGMLIESMAGVVGACEGKEQNATPFQILNKRLNREDEHVGEEEHTEYLKRKLVQNGYNRYGNFTLYSGITGEEMECEIFMGLVHYQRLKHMVSDKWQARRLGPVDAVTKQPIKGRKKGGAIRVGEMERDALVAHGCSFVAKDRFLHCSDASDAYLCGKCGSLLSSSKTGDRKKLSKYTCRLCNDGSAVTSYRFFPFF